MMSDEQMKNKLRCHGRFPNVELFGNPNFGNITIYRLFGKIAQ